VVVVVVVEAVEEVGAEEGEGEGGATAEISQKSLYFKGEEISFLVPFESNAGGIFILGYACFTEVGFSVSSVVRG
jgi:hypothetical protein